MSLRQLPMVPDGFGTKDQQINDLAKLTTRECHFIHEKAENPNAAQCSLAVQETTMGCAHGASAILLSAIGYSEHAGLIDTPRAEQMRADIARQNRALMSLDVRSFGEYEYADDLSQDFVIEHRQVIAERRHLRDQLLHLIQTS
jgi:hypothetical protein